MAVLRKEYAARGYEEVMTPLIFKQELWRISGHLQNYAENMFTVTPGMASERNPGTGDDTHSCCAHSAVEGDNEDIMGLKPMNCPAHCLIFAQVRECVRLMRCFY